MDPASFFAPLADNWAVAFGLGISMFGLTAIAGLLHPNRKDAVAHWLSGNRSEESWSTGFVSLFDAAFGVEHLSRTCFLRSLLASLITVTILWLIMGSASFIDLRIDADISWGTVLLIGLCTNVLADYVSLLETRWLLGHMPRSALAQAGVLMLDLILTAAIIWGVLFVFIRTPFYGGDFATFGEILGAFSMLSLFFYSTFLTSLWTWAYVVTTWLMRLAIRLRLSYWLDVQGQPIKVLSLLIATSLGVVTLLGSMALTLTLNRSSDGVSPIDYAFCSVFGGRVCWKVAKLTPSQQAELDFFISICENGTTSQCNSRALRLMETDGDTAFQLWTAACKGGSAEGCTNLGYLHEKGIGTPADVIKGNSHYRQGCDSGNAHGCLNLGLNYSSGHGYVQDLDLGRDLLRQACDGGSGRGCAELGRIYEQGIGVDIALAQAVIHYKSSCDIGYDAGCERFGTLLQDGIKFGDTTQDPAALYQQACDLGYDGACRWAGALR